MCITAAPLPPAWSASRATAQPSSGVAPSSCPRLGKKKRPEEHQLLLAGCIPGALGSSDSTKQSVFYGPCFSLLGRLRELENTHLIVASWSA